MLLPRRHDVSIGTCSSAYSEFPPSSRPRIRATRCSILRVHSPIPATALLLVHPIHGSPYRHAHPISPPPHLLLEPISIQLAPRPRRLTIPSRQLGFVAVALGDPPTTHAPLSGSKASKRPLHDKERASRHFELELCLRRPKTTFSLYRGAAVRLQRDDDGSCTYYSNSDNSDITVPQLAIIIASVLTTNPKGIDSCE